jgi:hypothetical protein
MHYLYVCHFSNGHIKVGRSINPMARIASHQDRVSCLGIELVEHQIFECVGHVIQAEAELIRRCSEFARKTNKAEWFEGLDFLDACEFANAASRFSFVEPAVERGMWAQILDDLKSAGKTQMQIAKACGCSQASISELSIGKTLDPRYSIAIGLLAMHREAIKQEA